MCLITEPCTVQRALTLAMVGDTIYLESGTYTAPNEADARVMWITKSRIITGSCDYSSGSAVCSPAKPPSIINGESERRAIHIQISSDTDPGEVTLNNLYILNGKGNITNGCPSQGGYTTLGCGGGIFQTTAPGYQKLDLVINNCRFESNRGAVDDGTVAGYGGAIIISASSSLKIYDSVFYGNTASFYDLGLGGAIYASSTDYIDIQNSTFEQNACSTNSGLSFGCALYIVSAQDVNLDGNSFNLNNPTTYLNTGSAVYSTGNEHFRINRNIFTHNPGDSVIYVQGDGVQVPNQLFENKFWHNGAVKVLDYRSNIPVNVFNNFIGDAFDPESDIRQAQGALLTGLYFSNTDSVQPADVAVIHNSIAHLDAGINLSGYVNLTLKNTILAWMRSTAVSFTNPSTVTALKTLTWFNLVQGYTDATRVNADPRFVNGIGGDFHIKTSSPAKDTASNEGFSSDIDGDHRPYPLNLPDIGGDEIVFYLRLPVIMK
jgi:hypothetical protein